MSDTDMDCGPTVTGTIECPEATHHGDPFRYCPVKGCGWMEPPQTVRRNDKRVTAAARVLHECPPDYEGPCWGPTESDIDRAVQMVTEHDRSAT